MTNTANPNPYLAHIRQAVKEKDLTRKQISKLEIQRNKRIKQLLDAEEYTRSTSTPGSNHDPTLYEIRASLDSKLRKDHNMKKEKRGRVFVEVQNEDGCQTLGGLEEEIRSFFPALSKSALSLSAQLPQVLEDGSFFCPEEEEVEAMGTGNKLWWSVNSDEDVSETFRKANEFFTSHNSDLAVNLKRRLKRPAILIHVKRGRHEPILPPAYLKGMPNPKETEAMTMLSFYSFPPGGIPDPEDFILFLKKVWEPFGALGRVYVAQEGVNAQMSVPTNVIDNFINCCSEIPEMGRYIENGINIDPIPLSMDEFSVAGHIDGKACPPFKNLLLKVRPKIVADGLDKSLNWESAGYDMPPLEWHEKLKEARAARQLQYVSGDTSPASVSTSPTVAPLIFDCRNSYETSVGIFEGAEPLATENFRDSWRSFEEKLKGKPKDTPIMTYCTGGIRCVKVGAYLSQEMGFTNVSRLAGGIIAYDKALNEKAPDEEPMFKGTNYVFDGRLGRQITKDILGNCITCEGKTNLLSNCMNKDCHQRIVQCSECRQSFLGCCSEKCKFVRVKVMHMET